MVKAFLVAAGAAVVGVSIFIAYRSTAPARPFQYDNVALIFVKPHGQTDKMANFIEKEIAAAGLVVVKQGQLPGAAIEEQGLIDAHYAAIGNYAMRVAPRELPLSAEVKRAFQEKFLVSFDEAAANSSNNNNNNNGNNNNNNNNRKVILNAGAAMNEYGWSGQQLDDKCQAAKAHGRDMKLAPGCYVAYIEEKNIFVINGFYGRMREEYVNSKAVVSWAIVSWPEGALPWSRFRAEVLGATNPAAAQPSSIRAKILREYKSLGLSQPPTTGTNCVHGSASPLEALNERRIWTAAKIETDPFGKLLLAHGISAATIDRMCSNPTINGKPLFDLVEDKDTSECAAMLTTLSKLL